MAKINGTIHEILEQLMIAEYGAHYLIIYPDATILKELYAQYTKIQLEKNNEIVVLIPYYETCDMVRRLCRKTAEISMYKNTRKKMKARL